MSISVSEPIHLETLPFDPELTPGAKNAIHTCLRVQRQEKVTVITDLASREIAASIVRQIEEIGAPYHAWVLEEVAERPLTDLPAEILATWKRARSACSRWWRRRTSCARGCR
jgi:leucyl aminopeptidase (aminopeptidase T)